ncbi:MAG TPA: phosphoethanolamine--lipid A transferase [Gammaproteobacteria bacterium]
MAILLTSLFVVCFDNVPFWLAVLRSTESESHRGEILLALLVLQVGMLSAVLALGFGTRMLKASAGALLILASATDYFISRYGVLIDSSMMRSVVQTNWMEASPLLTLPFFVHVALFGVIPAAVLAVVPLPRTVWWREACTRLAITAVSGAAVLAVIYANYAALASFAREHRDVRMLANPAYPLYALVRLLEEAHDRGARDGPRVMYQARRAAPSAAQSREPLLLILVLGETARADRFSVNGYPRDTNRYTDGLGFINFPEVTSCGTSTADSVPCLFSHLDRTRFSHSVAARRESLFELLERLDIDAVWRDNNTGCKNVCDPGSFESLATARDHELCDASGCYDEILLRGLRRRLADTSRDRFVVLHQRGSHGPAYFSNVPSWAKAYLPECTRPSLRECSQAEIDNAYDNTILYTDYFLSRVVGLLQEQSASHEVALLYVSDHGESLGEHGIYLHGFPYDMAPAEQTHVPMMFWAENGFLERLGIDERCVQAHAANRYSHDFVFHTVLSLLRVEAAEYRPELDLFAACRRRAGGLLSRAGSKGGTGF